MGQRACAFPLSCPVRYFPASCPGLSFGQATGPSRRGTFQDPRPLRGGGEALPSSPAHRPENPQPGCCFPGSGSAPVSSRGGFRAGARFTERRPVPGPGPCGALPQTPETGPSPIQSERSCWHLLVPASRGRRLSARGRYPKLSVPPGGRRCMWAAQISCPHRLLPEAGSHVAVE